jgi:photosystem II stability/assembly factor-like uncharacterized protein
MYRTEDDRGRHYKVAIKAISRPLAIRFILIILLFAILLPLRDISSKTSVELGWKAQNSGVLSRLSSIFFIDRQRGWAVGSIGSLIMTEDGGSTWRRIRLPESQEREHLRDVWFFKGEDTPVRMCLLGEYGMLQPRGAYKITFRAFVLFNSLGEEGWYEGLVARQPYRRPDTALGRLIEDDSGKLVLKEPDEYREYLRSPEPVMLRMSFVNDRVGWMCGESGAIQVTRDGGKNWSLQYGLTKKLLYDVAAIDENRVWIVGAGGTLLQTDDGGKQWIERRTGVTDALRAVYFRDSNNGWAVGSNGRIIATIDGGKSWRVQYSNTSLTLNDVHFVSATEGWIAGDRGILIHTTDGGVTWEGDRLDTHANLTGLFFVAPDCGWVVGTAGLIYKYGPI